MDWIPAKEARSEEIPISIDGPLAKRAREALSRDLTGTGFVPIGTATCHLDGDFDIFRCAIRHAKDDTEGVWVYVESRSTGHFSTNFLL